MVKIFATEIHGESHPMSMHILVTHLIAQYFTHDFSRNTLIPKLSNTDHRRLLPGGLSSSEGSTVATNVLSPH